MRQLELRSDGAPVATSDRLDELRLDGQVALITGGGQGIGAAAATLLASRGAAVALLDLGTEGIMALGSGLLADGREVIALEGDVSNVEDAEAAVGAVLDLWGRLDILVNCAGITGGNAPTWELSDEAWERTIRVNLTGTFNLCRAAAREMRSRGYGRIVNVASIAGKEGNPNAVHYSASKAGVIALTKSLGKELAVDGVLVNVIAPAVIETPMVEGSSPEHVAYMLARIPMGRMGQPSEVAALIAFLASPQLSFSTGAVYDISGGRATY